VTERLHFAAAVGFEAARRVTLLPEGHRSGRLHGHSFLVRIRVALKDGWARFPGGEVDQLRERLATAVAPLDYNELNREFTEPTDENIARWVRRRVELPDVDNVGVQSTLHEGVDLDIADHAHVWRRYIFESAHRLPNVPTGHKCGRMHGHGFEVILHADQDLGGREIGVDYDHLDELWAPIHVELHQACLNDIAGLENPTSELIASWIWRRLKPRLRELSWVTVFETANCGAHFDGREYRIWREMTLDSSMRLKRAPDGDPRRRLHGHTYTLRLHLRAPLDELMGWTIDFGDVKELFTPVFLQIDHQPLHEVVGGEDTDTPSLARWIKRRAVEVLPQLDRIDLYQSRGCGAILTWDGAAPALPV